MEPTNVPLPGSFRYALSCDKVAGSRIHVWGYVAVEDRMFMFQHATVEPEEPVSFRSFVTSLRVIGNPPRPLEGIAPLHGAIAVALGVIFGAVGWVMNKMAGRVAVNPWKPLVFLLVALTVGLTVFWSRRLPEALSSFRKGEAIGYSVMGPFFWVGLFGIWRWRVLEKRRMLERTGT